MHLINIYLALTMWHVIYWDTAVTKQTDITRIAHGAYNLVREGSVNKYIIHLLPPTHTLVGAQVNLLPRSWCAFMEKKIILEKGRTETTEWKQGGQGSPHWRMNMKWPYVCLYE